MTVFKWSFFLVILFLQNSIFAHASTPALIAPEIKENITKNFTKSLPSLKVDTLEATSIANLYQVTAGPVVMYVTSDGRYAFSGDVLDLQDGKTNITELARRKALMQALEKFGESNMIIYAPALSIKPHYSVTVFTDIECSYCQKFHAHIDKINQLGITVRYMAFPKTGQNTSAYNALVSTWCAKDRKAAFNQAMLGKVPPLQCYSHNVDKQFNLGALAGVGGTPTLVIDGQLVAGYFDPEELLALIKQIKQTKRSI